VKRLAAVCAVFLIVAAGCGSENRSANKPFKPKAGDIKLPAMPTRGLVIDKKGGVELIGLDGRHYGFLPGFSTTYPGFTSFLPLDSSRPRLGGKGKSYLLEANNGYAVRIKRNRDDLGYGFEHRQVSIWKMTEADEQVAALGDPNDEGEHRAEIYRDGKPFLYLGGGAWIWFTRDRGFITVSSSSPGGTRRLIDLSKGTIEPVPSGCIVYGRRAGVMNALCTGKGDEHGRPTLSLRRKDGKSWPVVHAWAHAIGGEWQGAVLSPDEHHLVVTLGVPCDSAMVEIVDAQGPKRKMLGPGQALGWSAAGKAIVFLWDPVKAGCGDSVAPSTGAVYAVDPVTLKRTLIVKTASAKFWDKTPVA
jgi:hypothetical protein